MICKCCCEEKVDNATEGSLDIPSLRRYSGGSNRSFLVEHFLGESSSVVMIHLLSSVLFCDSVQQENDINQRSKITRPSQITIKTQ